MMSMVIIVPMISQDNLLPYFIASSVYAFGRLPDYIDDYQSNNNSYILDLWGIFSSSLIILMCFFLFSSLSMGLMNNKLVFAIVLMGFVVMSAFVDLLIFVLYLEKNRYTKSIVCKALKEGKKS